MSSLPTRALMAGWEWASAGQVGRAPALILSWRCSGQAERREAEV